MLTAIRDNERTSFRYVRIGRDWPVTVHVIPQTPAPGYDATWLVTVEGTQHSGSGFIHRSNAIPGQRGVRWISEAAGWRCTRHIRKCTAVEWVASAVDFGKASYGKRVANAAV